MKQEKPWPYRSTFGILHEIFLCDCFSEDHFISLSHFPEQENDKESMYLGFTGISSWSPFNKKEKFLIDAVILGENEVDKMLKVIEDIEIYHTETQYMLTPFYFLTENNFMIKMEIEVDDIYKNQKQMIIGLYFNGPPLKRISQKWKAIKNKRLNECAKINYDQLMAIKNYLKEFKRR